MIAITREHPMHLHEMMERLGIEPAAGVFPRLSLRYATAFRQCDACQCKKACQEWLEHAPSMVNFAPCFCRNAEILFELQYDQPGPRRINR